MLGGVWIHDKCCPIFNNLPYFFVKHSLIVDKHLHFD